MSHGTREFFLERDRSARRVSLLSAALGVLCLAALLLVSVQPGLRRAINDPRRFGFEGPDQYVRRIELLAVGGSGPSLAAPMLSHVVLTRPRRGEAGGLPTEALDRAAGRSSRFRHPGLGESDQELFARALRRAGGVPVFRSQDLVIEELVEPDYPPAARDRGIEGRVALLALVDTTGHVVDVEVVGDDDERLLVEAATAAVLQCRFRPFEVEGRREEVYAMFRFAFRLY